MDALLRERSAVEGSNSTLDAVLEQTAAARSALVAQRDSIMRSAQGMGRYLSRRGVLSGLIGDIHRRRTRNQWIIAFVIAVGICLLFYLAMR